MKMISRQKGLLLGVITALPGSIAFMPCVSRAGFHIHGQRESPKKLLADPYEVASYVADASHHPILEALMSTLYTAAIQIQPAHGHSQPLFGAPDQYLLQGRSILPAPGAFDALGLQGPDIQLTPKLAEFFDYAQSKGTSIIDPRDVIKVNDFLPGFTKTGHVLPEPKTFPISETGYKLELAQAIGYQKVFYQLPKAALAAAFVDFFLVSPGLDAYKEEIEEDPEGAIAGTITEFGVRTAVLSIVAALTLAIFNK